MPSSPGRLNTALRQALVPYRWLLGPRGIVRRSSTDTVNSVMAESRNPGKPGLSLPLVVIFPILFEVPLAPYVFRSSSGYHRPFLPLLRVVSMTRRGGWARLLVRWKNNVCLTSLVTSPASVRSRVGTGTVVMTSSSPSRVALETCS